MELISRAPEKFGALEEYCERFLESLDIKSSSKETYKRQLRAFIAWCRAAKLEQCSRQELLKYREFLHEEKLLSALSIAGYLTAVRRFFEWLEAHKVYPNIAKGIRGPKRKRGFRKDVLTVEQIKLLLNSIDRTTLEGKRDYALLNLMIRTGLRTIEIARALKEDITRQAGQPILLVHGKGRDSKDELVLLTEHTLGPIREYLAARGKVRDQEPIFASHSTKNKGRRLTTRSISRIVKNRLRAINLDDSRLTAHSLRHTAITLSLLAGATPQEARALARHADINTTLIYAHNINRIQQAPERKIDEFLE